MKSYSFLISGKSLGIADRSILNLCCILKLSKALAVEAGTTSKLQFPSVLIGAIATIYLIVEEVKSDYVYKGISKHQVLSDLVYV